MPQEREVIIRGAWTYYEPDQLHPKGFFELKAGDIVLATMERTEDLDWKVDWVASTEIGYCGTAIEALRSIQKNFNTSQLW